MDYDTAKADFHRVCAAPAAVLDNGGPTEKFRRRVLRLVPVKDPKEPTSELKEPHQEKEPKDNKRKREAIEYEYVGNNPLFHPDAVAVGDLKDNNEEAKAEETVEVERTHSHSVSEWGAAPHAS